MSAIKKVLIQTLSSFAYSDFDPKYKPLLRSYSVRKEAVIKTRQTMNVLKEAVASVTPQTM